MFQICSLGSEKQLTFSDRALDQSLNFLRQGWVSGRVGCVGYEASQAPFRVIQNS